MDKNNSSDLIKDITFEQGETSVVDAAARERVKWQVRAKHGPFPVDPECCDIWAGNTRDVTALGSGSFSELMSSLATMGQQVPAIARISPVDQTRLEIIAGACRLTALMQINEGRVADERLPIIVELRNLDDEAAFKIVDAENRGRSDLAPIEKARFYQLAIDSTYHTEAALAEALGLNKSTINRTLAIIKLPIEVTGLIGDPRQISAARAAHFMSDWGIPDLQQTLRATIQELNGSAPLSAAVVFKALKEAVAPPEQVADAPIVHDGVEIGMVRPRKDGGIVIELNAEARSLGWRRASQATGAALQEMAKTKD